MSFWTFVRNLAATPTPPLSRNGGPVAVDQYGSQVVIYSPEALTALSAAGGLPSRSTLSAVLCTWQISVTTGAAALVPAWASATAYKIGQVVTNDTLKMYRCITAGTSAGSGGPTGTNSNITDNTAHWAYVSSFGNGVRVTNTHASESLYVGSSGLTTSVGSLIPSGLWKDYPIGDLTQLYVIGSGSLTATVEACP